jgi:cytochrome c oxidase subunit 2
MFKLLIILVIVLGIIAILQLARVRELTAALSKKREEDISYADNKMNAFFMLLFAIGFFVSFIFLMIRYGDYLPPSASQHGEDIDTLMAVNMVIIITVFFLVNSLLFYFAYKYYYRKDRKAKFFPHDNRLELIWTIIPSIVLAFIIIYGLATWNDITGKASTDAIKIEVYSKQFDWTVRYPGDNNQFGASSFNLITNANPLGIITQQTINERVAEIEAEIDAVSKELEERRKMMPESKVEVMEEKIQRLVNTKTRIKGLQEDKSEGQSLWETGLDDKIVKGEMHIPVGREIEFVFRSRDVIHSAYMPHFRAQMNSVPGLPTRFKMTPTITTSEMRSKLNDPDFDYVLLCNKICGAAHFNMQIKIVVETQEEYDKWLAEQKAFSAPETTEENPAAEVSPETNTTDSLALPVQDNVMSTPGSDNKSAALLVEPKK